MSLKEGYYSVGRPPLFNVAIQIWRGWKAKLLPNKEIKPVFFFSSPWTILVHRHFSWRLLVGSNGSSSLQGGTTTPSTTVSAMGLACVRGSTCDQSGKNPLKYSAMAGYWTRATVRFIHSPTELSWLGPRRGQTVRFIHSPTELSCFYRRFHCVSTNSAASPRSITNRCAA